MADHNDADVRFKQALGSIKKSVEELGRMITDKHLTAEEVNDIVTLVSQNFRCSGGGDCTQKNAITAALMDQPVRFAMGVEVVDVVKFVAAALGYKTT